MQSQTWRSCKQKHTRVVESDSSLYCVAFAVALHQCPRCLYLQSVMLMSGIRRRMSTDRTVDISELPFGPCTRACIVLRRTSGSSGMVRVLSKPSDHELHSSHGRRQAATLRKPGASYSFRCCIVATYTQAGHSPRFHAGHLMT